MRSHKFINSLLYLIIQLLAKERRTNGNNGGIRCFFVLFTDKRLISQFIHFKVMLAVVHIPENQRYSNS